LNDIRRMRLFEGLHAKFMSLIGLTLVVMLAVVAMIWQRQSATQEEVLRLSREATRTLVFDRLRQRGEAQVTQAADLLVIISISMRSAPPAAASCISPMSATC
jgi:hypothetical protein